MERDEFDLVAVGRGILANPDWPAKILDDRWDELRTFHVGLLGTLH